MREQEQTQYTPWQEVSACRLAQAADFMVRFLEGYRADPDFPLHHFNGTSAERELLSGLNPEVFLKGGRKLIYSIYCDLAFDRVENLEDLSTRLTPNQASMMVAREILKTSGWTEGVGQ